MPRPYGWIRGEGTTKNQRWGLAGLGDTAGNTSIDLNLSPWLNGGGFTPVGDDSFSSMTLNVGPNMGNVPGNPITQYLTPSGQPSNTNLLIAGIVAIGAALLITRL